MSENAGGIKQIKIRECVVLMDDDDYEFFKDMAMHVRHASSPRPYAYSMKTPVHRLIMKPPLNMVVDHINHNTLDNRKANLRVCTRSQNMWNRRAKKNGSSRFKGVSFNKSEDLWEAGIIANYKRYFLGRYETEIEAAQAYNEAALKYHGDFACLNEV